MKLRLPSWAALVLSLFVGVVAFLNQQGTFNIGQPWHTLVNAGLVWVAALGISPLIHGALSTVLKLTYAQALGLAGVLAAATVGIATVNMNATVRSVIVAVLTVLAGALAGPDSPVPSIPKTVAKPKPVATK